MDQNIASGAPIAPKQAQKGSKGLKIATTISVVAAICGIGFGVYGMMQSANKTEMSDLKVQVKDSDGNVVSVSGSENEDGAKTVTLNKPIAKNENPVIKSVKQNVYYDVEFSIPYDGETLTLYVRNGNIQDCTIMGRDSRNRNCSVKGLNGEIYKVAIVGGGHAISEDSTKLGFIMSDGTVKYASIIKAFSSSSVVVEGQMKIDGFVTDVFDVNIIEEGVGGYAASVFTLSDGKNVTFDRSMF